MLFRSQITGAELHSTGERLVVRVYSGIYEYRLDPAFGMERLDLAQVSEVVQAGDVEPQGEAVCYDAPGRGIYSISEDAGGRGGVIAVDAKGNVAMPFNSEGMYRGVIRTDGKPWTAIKRD
mgnify:CR=1 FL=1